MKRIFALLLCLGLALFLGCAGAEQATGLTPAQEARAIALAAGLTGLSQEQAAALSLTVEASAVGESIRFRCPQEPAYELLSQFSIGVDRRGIFRFSQPLHISDEPVQYASEQAERERLGEYLETALSGLLQAPGADYSDIRPRPFATAIREKISPSACGNASSFSSPLPPIPWPEPSFS